MNFFNPKTADHLVSLAREHAGEYTQRVAGQWLAIAENAQREGRHEDAARAARASLLESVGKDHQHFKEADRFITAHEERLDEQAAVKMLGRTMLIVAAVLVLLAAYFFR